MVHLRLLVTMSMEVDLRLQSGSPGSELMKQSGRLSDLVSEHTPTVLSAFAKEVRRFQSPRTTTEADKLCLQSVDSSSATDSKHGKDMEIQGTSPEVNKSDPAKCAVPVGDVESRYNYNQYTTKFVHSLQT